MEQCKHCGALLPPGSQFCPVCGAHQASPAPGEAAGPEPAAPKDPAGGQVPHYTAPPKSQGPQGQPLSTLQCLLTLLAAFIPFAGLVFLCIWSFGKGGRPGRKQLARACLAVRLALAVLVGALALWVAIWMHSWANYRYQDPYDYYGGHGGLPSWGDGWDDPDDALDGEHHAHGLCLPAAARSY